MVSTTIRIVVLGVRDVSSEPDSPAAPALVATSEFVVGGGRAMPFADGEPTTA